MWPSPPPLNCPGGSRIADPQSALCTVTLDRLVPPWGASLFFSGSPPVLNDVQRLELFWVGLVEITTTSLGAFTCSLCVIELRNVDISRLC